jgi:hypothetical protein
MIVRCYSHRAREKLHRLVGKDNCRSYYRIDWKEGEYIEVSSNDEVFTIKGITRARIDVNILALCWSYNAS